MSWHPQVEKRRRELPWAYVKHGTDALLTPLRAVLESHAAKAQARLSNARQLSTTDRRPAWTEGVDISPVVALCILRCLDELLQPASPLWHGELPPGGETALEQLIMFQELSLIIAWGAICALQHACASVRSLSDAHASQSCAGARSFERQAAALYAM